MIKRCLKKIVAAAVMVSLVVSMSGCGAKKSGAEKKWGIDEFNFIMIPGEDTEKSVQLRDNMAKDLSEVIGIPVNVYRATDYNAAVEALRTGNAQLAQLGPFSYITAVDRAGAESVCVLGKNGNTGYQSYFITQADSDINCLEDLEGRTFAFVDAASTSGNVVPCNEILTLIDNKLTFDELHVDGKFFKSATYSGSHPNSVEAVVQGNVDAAAVSSATLENLIKEGIVNESEFKIIYESPVIPGSPVAIKGDIPQELKDLVIEFLLNYDEEEYFGDPDTRYVAIEDSEYAYIRELQEKYELTD
ncbi:phosphate/phosphite/phosphonate ABC transporter substrate-binding protein [Anaerosporobacter sp.]|uniref:phosphate/phosphite/phosphonate ABC transporter substrate-binding protein n=1 Tax=Anaerosporobacter sp. TaxID=1872529 RepID=UPI00286F72EE|nr:phosphate/phosphite/phosphonate ABC transporter substrate-binding protein [Anaerosporobacter sp.]